MSVRISTSTRALSVLASLTLATSACGIIGGDDDTATGTAASEPTATDEGATPASDAAEGAEAAAPATGVTASIPWVAPEGMTLTASAVSPDGSLVALAFAETAGLETISAEIVEYEIASGAEAWRTPIEDAGLFGPASLMYTDSGVSMMLLDLDGNRLITTQGPSVAAQLTGITPDVCGQFLNGTVDAAAVAAFTVTPGGFCRIDLRSGTVVEIQAADLVTGGSLADSIRYDESGNLVASVTDQDFVPHFFVVDPATLQPIEAAAGEPPSGADLYGDLLEDGAGILGSSETRVAQTADGSTTAIVQPDRIDVVVS